MKQFSLLFFYLLLNYVSAGSFEMMRHGFPHFPPMQNSSLNSDYPYEVFEQIYDHNDMAGFQRTFKQRYQVLPDSLEQSAQSDRPVFLWIDEGGFSGEMGEWGDQTALKYYAKQYGARVFGLEHRFYGLSFPDKFPDPFNLTILTIEQALADVAYFIEGMNIKYNLTKKNKWIVFGRRYGGSLAAWARLKYPHLIHAAVTSSAPLLAKVDFPEFVDLTRASLSAINEDCGQVYHEAGLEFKKHLKTPEGRVTIQKYFRVLCEPVDISNELNAQWLVYVNIIAKSFSNCYTCSDDMKKVCDVLTNKTYGPPLERFTAAVEGFYTSCADAEFVNTLNAMKYYFINVFFWFYQRATQLGMYATSENENSAFGPTLPLSLYENINIYFFGERYNLELTKEGVRRTNLNYGGLDIQVDRVVYVHGSLDPFHVLGITNSTNPNSPAIFIKGGGPGSEMWYPTPFDIPEVKQARKKIMDLIGKWLKV